MKTEREIEERLVTFLEKKGYSTRRQIKVRGKVIDIVAIRNREISLMEVKGEKGDVLKGIGQAIYQVGSADYSILALPQSKVNKEIIQTCQNSGVGLLSINDDVVEICKPKKTDPMPSVKSRVLKIKKRKTAPPVKKEGFLIKLFTSEVRVRLLELFLLNPRTEFHLRGLSRRVETGPTYVKKELGKLEELGLVAHRRKGNLLLFKSNKQSPIYEDLKKIFIKTKSLGALMEGRIKDYNEIKYALIYGSFAQGVETETSDIDLLVVGNISEDELHKAVMEFEEKTSREMNYVLWTEKELKKKSKEGISLLVDIAENKVIMLKGDENEFRKAIGTR